jgi:hypothetical protein
MADTAIIDLLKTVSGMSGPALMIGILWTGYRQKWVWGWHHAELRADRDYWRSVAMRTSTVAEQTVTTAAPPAGLRG